MDFFDMLFDAIAIAYFRGKFEQKWGCMTAIGIFFLIIWIVSLFS